MKINVETTDVEFSPVEVSLTIETQQELDALNALFDASGAVTEMLLESGYLEEDAEPVLIDFMDSIYQELPA